MYNSQLPQAIHLPGGLLCGLLGPPLRRRGGNPRPGAQRRDGPHSGAPGAAGAAARRAGAGGDGSRGSQRGVTAGNGVKVGLGVMLAVFQINFPEFGHGWSGF